MHDPFDLTRFVMAQERVWPAVRDELASGRKRTHWMWFVFPQHVAHVQGATLVREPDEVLIRPDLHDFLARRYEVDGITASEIDGVIRDMEVLPASDLHDSNRAIMKWVSDGYPLKREDRADKDLHLGLIDVDEPVNNRFKLIN